MSEGGETPVPEAISAQASTRDLIVSASRDVFIDRGYFDTRITDITSAAGVAAGSFYTYFDSKELAFEAMLDNLDAAIHPAPWSPADDVPTWIRANTRHYLGEFAQHAQFWRRVEQAALGNRDVSRMLAARRDRYVAQVSETIGAWTADGLANPGIPADAVALALAATTEQFAFQWFVLEEPAVGEPSAGDPRHPDLDAAADQLSDLWCRALRVGHAEAARP